MVDLRPGTMCLTPRCVCLAKVKEGCNDIFWISRTLTQHIRGTMCSTAVRKCLGWRDIAGVPMETHLRPRKNTSARAGQRRSREVRIPHWVAHSDMTPADARRCAATPCGCSLAIPDGADTPYSRSLPKSAHATLFPRPCMLLLFTFS